MLLLLQNLASALQPSPSADSSAICYSRCNSPHAPNRLFGKSLTDSPPESGASSGDSDRSFSCISGWLIWFTLSSGMRELSVNCHQWSSSSIKGFRTAVANMEVGTIKELHHNMKFHFRSNLLINLLDGFIWFGLFITWMSLLLSHSIFDSI